MIVEELIEKDYYSLNSMMNFKEASSVFNESKQSDLPVIDDSNYLGIVLFDQIKGREDSLDQISTFKEQYRQVSVSINDRLIDAILKMTHFGLESIPILDDEEKVLGVVKAVNLWNLFAIKSSFIQPGGWVILSMKKNDLKLSEIAYIVESNNMTMLMHFVSFASGIDLIDVHLKLDRENVNELVQHFQRLNYNVTDVIQAKKYEDDWDNRFDQLMRFFST